MLSALAAIILKISWLEELSLPISEYREDCAALLAGAATIITTLSAAGGYGRKWQTNRLSRGRIEWLQIELSDPDANAAQ